MQTIAELYRDEATATKGLAFWRGVTKALSAKKVNGVTVSLSPFEALVGDGAFAFELTYQRDGKPLLYSSQEVTGARRLGAATRSEPRARRPGSAGSPGP